MFQNGQLWLRVALQLSIGSLGLLFGLVAMAHSAPSAAWIVVLAVIATAVVAVGIQLVMIAWLDRRANELRSRFPESVVTGLLVRDETRKALFGQDASVMRGPAIWYLEVGEVSIRFWRGTRDLELIATVPLAAILEISTFQQRLGLRQIAAINIRLRSEHGTVDLPLLATGSGLRIVNPLNRDDVSDLARTVKARASGTFA